MSIAKRIRNAIGSRHEIPVRKPSFQFDESIPKHWLHGNAVATHIFNGLNLIIPDGERFFIRAVHDHLDQIQDPALREQIKGFCGQEGRHAYEIEHYFDALRMQGYQFDRFLKYFRQFIQLTRGIPAPLRLSITAAAEHYTATLSMLCLEGDLLDHVHPTMRKLILWHSTEEIEHKAVAYDVLQATHPSYTLRILGFAIATLALLVWGTIAMRMLLQQDGLDHNTYRSQRLQFLARNNYEDLRRVRRGILAYFRYDFHPNQEDTLDFARQRLAEVGI